MLKELLTMSSIELERIQVIRQVCEGKLKQREAGVRLNLSKRQMIRLVKAFRHEGNQALLSKGRGKGGNHRHDEEFKFKIKLLVEKHYADFGPSFASEQLLKRHTLKINKETLRQWMDEWGLWTIKPKKVLQVRQNRERRPSFGELIQIDGSAHDWFEGRREKCCLLVFIDDATSRLVGLRFEESETTEGYFRLCRSYLNTYGRPLAFYSDKFGVFRVNLPGKEDCETQFSWAMRELGIELICAHSPQAKGRVERANQTLQDRLVKELRLRDIDTLEAANDYLPEFISEYNERFAVVARNDRDVHRKDLPQENTLALIFSIQHQRKLSKHLECAYNNRLFQIQGVGHGYRLQHKAVTICENLQGEMQILYRGKPLRFKEHDKQQRACEVIDAKGIERAMERLKLRARQSPPKANHPWRQYELVAERKMRQERSSACS